MKDHPFGRDHLLSSGDYQRAHGEDRVCASCKTASLLNTASYLAVLTRPQYVAQRQVSCVNETISTIYWPVNVEGTFQDSRFVPASGVQVGHVDSCPAEGIQ